MEKTAYLLSIIFNLMQTTKIIPLRTGLISCVGLILLLILTILISTYSITANGQLLNNASNASIANNTQQGPLFFKKWGYSCLLASDYGCDDPDTALGPLAKGDGQFWSITGIAANSRQRICK